MYGSEQIPPAISGDSMGVSENVARTASASVCAGWACKRGSNCRMSQAVLHSAIILSYAEEEEAISFYYL